jgi:hypothetical protein
MKADHDVATEPSVGEPLSTSFAYQRFDRVRLGRFRPHVVVLAAMGRRVCHDGTGGDPVFAALWRRAAAWLVDVLIFAGATLGVVAATGIRRPLALAWRVVWSGPTSITPAVLHQLVGAGIVVSLGVLLGGFVLWVVYRVVCTGYWGRTAGKCLFGIQVVRAEEPTAAPGLRRGAIRWVLPPLAGVLPLPGSGMLLYLMAVRDQSCQGGHDRAARTVVIRRQVHWALRADVRPQSNAKVDWGDHVCDWPRGRLRRGRTGGKQTDADQSSAMTAIQLTSTNASGRISSVTPTAVHAGYGSSRNSAAMPSVASAWLSRPTW